MSSSRSRASRVQQHVHCDSCYSRRCRARVEAGVCCVITPCRLHCGALFHLCKEEDHLLLCPNVRVPCLNVGYGCSLHMPRSCRAAHLQVCPASVVCCSMEWLRWPSDETSPHNDIALKENAMKEREQTGEALDLAMALVDQSDLYDRLKMKPLYPELVEEEEEEVEIKEEKKEEMAEEVLVNGVDTDTKEEHLTSAAAGNGVCQKDIAEALRSNVGPISGINKEKYDLCEMMFGMERGACTAAQENQDNPKEKPKHGEKSKSQMQQDGASKNTRADQTDAGTKDAAADKNCPPPDTSKSGLAPWQEGVLERLRTELTPQEYNMYVVHHGRMLVSFGQIQACTPREKDFVYGSLEPIPVQTLRSFKVPDSYHYRRRVHLYDVAARAQSEARGVDTSDLTTNEEDWFSDEAEATLLGYAEKAVMGHKISESKASDGLYVDVGTQTHSFHTAPFKSKTTLAEVMVDRPLKLRLQLQAESLSGRNNATSCAFTQICGHSFHRREFASHFRNAHSDIQMGLSGWFEQRCPLAYLGCTYIHRRFHPSTHKATVYYNQQLKTFNLRPTLEASLGPNIKLSKRSEDSSTTQRRRGIRGGGVEDSLSCLPYEVLCHMASFLDSMSLSQLALVSKLMRQVCSTLLQERGMVTLRWERKTTSYGGARWRAKPVWEFSHLFSPVDSWHMADIPPISAHLKSCPFYETSPHKERIPLPSMSEKQEQSQERMSLVKHFTGNRQKL
ncbi:F-box only protein 40 [Halichoeres trimaculatus]|uniref:F-box only protein 40 n=1 Tax=Halichoeres trimaculatus TaxID=147232 RepID=UPI003D9F1B8D